MPLPTPAAALTDKSAIVLTWCTQHTQREEIPVDPIKTQEIVWIQYALRAQERSAHSVQRSLNTSAITLIRCTLHTHREKDKIHFWNRIIWYAHRSHVPCAASEKAGTKRVCRILAQVQVSRMKERRPDRIIGHPAHIFKTAQQGPE